ncbi:MAG: 50S ribosomal protein L17 [Patescibacteria group bacterium]
MKHLKKSKTFSRKNNTKSLTRNMMNSLIIHGKIKTTTPKAKYIRGSVEKLITLAKKQNVSSLRILLARLPKKSAFKLYYEFAAKYKDRKGGFTRITKLPLKRIKDSAELSTIEFVE